MAKTNASFNLSKSTKLIAATIVDKERRRTFINHMIDAEHSFIAGKSRKWSDPASSQKSREVPKE